MNNSSTPEPTSTTIQERTDPRSCYGIGPPEEPATEATVLPITFTSSGETAHPASILLRPAEVARRLAISRTRVYELMRSGDLQPVFIGSSRRVALTEVIDFIERNQAAA